LQTQPSLAQTFYQQKYILYHSILKS